MSCLESLLESLVKVDVDVCDDVERESKVADLRLG